MGGAPSTVYWRGVRVDPTTADMLNEAARLVGDDIYLKPIQGSYSTSTSASGGTHDGGGTVDIDCTGLTDEQARRIETTLRRVGNAAWWRPKTSYWKSHVHSVRQDCGDLSSQARTQVSDYRAGYSGIPIGGRTTKDTGTRSYVSVTWGSYDNEEIDMTTATELAAQLKALAEQATKNDQKNQIRANALAAAIQALAAGVEPAVEQAVKDALTEAVVDVNVNFPAVGE